MRVRSRGSGRGGSWVVRSRVGFLVVGGELDGESSAPVGAVPVLLPPAGEVCPGAHFVTVRFAGFRFGAGWPGAAGAGLALPAGDAGVAGVLADDVAEFFGAGR